MRFTGIPELLATTGVSELICWPKTFPLPLPVRFNPKVNPVKVADGEKVGVGVREGVVVGVMVLVGVQVLVGIGLGVFVEVGVGPVMVIVVSEDHVILQLEV